LSKKIAMSIFSRRPPSPAHIALLVALSAQGFTTACSSSSGPGSSGAGDDAAAGTSDAGGEAAATGTSDAAGEAAQSCEASVLPPADAGGACDDCINSHCRTQLAACAADCVCGPIEACLELTGPNNYPGCPGAMDAIFNGEVPLMNIAGCAAMNCQGPCFSSDAGGGG
jgi:hypothetical protein